MRPPICQPYGSMCILQQKVGRLQPLLLCVFSFAIIDAPEGSASHQQANLPKASCGESTLLADFSACRRSYPAATCPYCIDLRGQTITDHQVAWPTNTRVPRRQPQDLSYRSSSPTYRFHLFLRDPYRSRPGRSNTDLLSSASPASRTRRDQSECAAISRGIGTSSSRSPTCQCNGFQHAWFSTCHTSCASYDTARAGK